MNKFFFFLFISLSLPMISPAQETNITAEEANKKGDDYFKQKKYYNAFEWYKRAAEMGYAPAQCNLGAMYDGGYGVVKDFSESFKWYQKAADQDYAIAQYRIGLKYEWGKGVTEDKKKCIEWITKSANQGYSIAQYELGYMYDYGKVVEEDVLKAFEWYQKAAEQGYSPAQHELGRMYHFGNKAVPKDDKKAIEWYKKAANQDYPISQDRLGFMYQYGYGVEQDYEIAIEWYTKAADKGWESAKKSLASLQKEMGSKKKNLVQSTATKTKTKEELKSNGLDVAANTKSTDRKEPIQQIASKQESNPKVEPYPNVETLPKEETFLVDTDIPVISRVNRNTFAIIIANEDYMDEAKVDFAKNDGEVFKNYCHKTLGVPEKNIHYLPNATLAKMFGELDWLRQVCEAYGGEANVIFYYSGHGFPDEQSHSAYLLPIDGSSRLLRTCFSVSELYEMLGSMPSKRVTVLMDACFSGTKRSGGMLASAKGVAIKVKSDIPKGNMVVMSAAQGDETAYFHHEAKHGLFTYYLLKKLKETKGSVTLGELSSYIQNEVRKFSIVENRKSQTPTVLASDKLIGSWQSLNF